MPVRIVGSGSIEGVADYEALSVAHPDAAGTNMVLSADGSVAFDSVPASIQSAIDAVPPGGFDAAVTIVASDAAWPVPTLGNPVVKVTVVGGGGGGGGRGAGGAGNMGGNGGSTIFGENELYEISASGGNGGRGGWNTSAVVPAGEATISNNGGDSGRVGYRQSAPLNDNGNYGFGGEIKSGYINLDNVSSVNVVVGAGGSAGTSAGNGGRGEIVVEYKAAL